MNIVDVKRELEICASAEDAVFLQRFFKTGKGQYGEGDVFIGVRMPVIRQICRQFKDLPITELTILVDSPVHEHRMAALIIAANQFKKANDAGQQVLYDFYFAALMRGKVNNWDLIDVTCEHVMGAYLYGKDTKILYQLAKSKSLWERRAAIMASFAFIKKGDPKDTLALAEVLLYDKEDLIQKAVGWMLREVGKRIDRQLLLQFLDNHAATMPRTMLRYAIEHLPPDQRQQYMSQATKTAKIKP